MSGRLPRAQVRPACVLLVMLAALASCLLLLACAGTEPPDAGTLLPGEPERHLWLSSYASLVRRADLGDAEAARLALEMRQQGPWVYGMRFEATADQLQRWREQSLAAQERG
ncbi:MAG TPA: hypothetical protein VF169_27830 [Albitalea sp.]|uniref:hypothetical protein n=1 Tax=Piscinibacter sp. TaxID=1903157 RepID=UPI002ECFE31C